MLMLEPASILTLESFRRLPPIVHKGNPGLQLSGMACTKERLRNDPAPVYSRESHLWTGTTGSVVKSRLPPSSSTATPVNRPGAMQRTDPTDPTSSHSCMPSMDLSVLNTLHYDFIPDTAHFFSQRGLA